MTGAGNTHDAREAKPIGLLLAAGAPLAILLASYGVDYLSQVLFGRWLGRSDYGNFGVAVSVATFFAYLATLGADEAVPRFLPTYLEQKRYPRAAGSLRAHFASVVLAGLLTAAAGTALFVLLKRRGLDHPLVVIWWIVPIIAIAEFLYVSLTSLQRTVPAMLGHLILWPLVALIVSGAFRVAGGLTDDRTVFAFGVGVTSVLPVYVVLLRRALPSDLWRVGSEYDPRLWVRTAVPMLLTTVVYYALGQVDIYVMEHVGDEREVGMLLACVKTSDFVYLTYSAAYLIVAPRVAPLAEANRMDELRVLVHRIVLVVFGISAATALVLAFFGQEILGWFGAGFVAGQPTLLVLLLSNVIVASLSLAWPLLSLAGHERVPAPGLVAALLALVVSAELAVPRFGMLGAAVCRGCVMVSLFAWLAVQTRSRVGIALWQVRAPKGGRR